MRQRILVLMIAVLMMVGATAIPAFAQPVPTPVPTPTPPAQGQGTQGNSERQLVDPYPSLKDMGVEAINPTLESFGLEGVPLLGIGLKTYDLASELGVFDTPSQMGLYSNKPGSAVYQCPQGVVPYPNASKCQLVGHIGKNGQVVPTR